MVSLHPTPLRTAPLQMTPLPITPLTIVMLRAEAASDGDASVWGILSVAMRGMRGREIDSGAVNQVHTWGILAITTTTLSSSMSSS